MRPRRSSKLLLTGAAALALLAGCASGGKPKANPAPPTTAATATLPTVTAPPPNPVLIAAELKPAETLHRIGDVDGDGRPDSARLHYLGGFNWELIVNLTSLGQRTVRFQGAQVAIGMGGEMPGIIGSTDADGDGHAEIFVKFDSGASTEELTIFKLADRNIVQVTTGGQPLELGWGGSLGHQDGFRCEGPRLLTVGALRENPDYKRFDYQVDTYFWRGAELILSSKESGQANGSARTDYDFPEAYSGVICGDLARYPWPSPPSTSAKS